MNYYNEFDPKAAYWLRCLINAGLIPKGIVDERSIKEVQPSDLQGFRQCHFFAGIGGWLRAFELAGISAAENVWSGSCPCQSYSNAGNRKGNDDERNLWPEFFRLIRQCKPASVWGEQVAAAIRFGWLDGIQTDLEGEGYSVGHAVLGAHSVGAPHIRQRLYWVAQSVGGRCEERSLQTGRRTEGQGTVDQSWFAGGLPNSKDDGEGIGNGRDKAGKGSGRSKSGRRGQAACTVGNAHGARLGEYSGGEPVRQEQPSVECAGGTGGLGNTDGSEDITAKSGQQMPSEGCDSTNGNGGAIQGTGIIRASGMAYSRPDAGRTEQGNELQERDSGTGESGSSQLADSISDGAEWDESEHGQGRGVDQVGNFWSDFELIPCRDGKARRVKSGVRCLAHGVSGRVAQLRGLGNAIVPQVAAEFIRAFTERVQL